MKFYFCEKCGRRLTEKDIEDGKGRDKKLRGVYCTSCAVGVMTMETLPISDADARQILQKSSAATRPQNSASSSVPPPTLRPQQKSNVRLKTKARDKRAITVQHRPSTASSRWSTTRQGGPAPSSSQTLVVGFLAVGMLLIVVGVVLLSTRHSAKQTATNQSATHPSNPPPEVVPRTGVASHAARKTAAPLSTTAQISKAHFVGASRPPVRSDRPPSVAVGMEDVREGFARRKLVELQAMRREKKVHIYYVRQQFEQFVQFYASTKAGREAAVVLQTMPVVEPPVPPDAPTPNATAPYQILFACLCDSADEVKYYGSGQKDSQEIYPGKVFAWRAKPLPHASSFSNAAHISFGDKRIPITANTWLRVAVKLKGASNVCVHSSIGSGLYERHVHRLPQGKWLWLTLKRTDYLVNIRGTDKHPSPGMVFTGTTISAGRNGKPSTLWLGPVIVGDGPLPHGARSIWEFAKLRSGKFLRY